MFAVTLGRRSSLAQCGTPLEACSPPSPHHHATLRRRPWLLAPSSGLLGVGAAWLLGHHFNHRDGSESTRPLFKAAWEGCKLFF